jgi:hypothetical protein
VAEPWEFEGFSPAPTKKANGFAVAGVLFGAIGGCVFGIIFGVIALVQIRRSGEPGRGTAITGIVLSCLWIGVVAYASTHDDFLGPDRDSNGSITSGGTLAATGLKVGDCVEDLGGLKEISDVPAVTCTEPHRAEVYGFLVLDRPEYPGDEELADLAGAQCLDAFDELPGLPAQVLDDTVIRIISLQPVELAWVSGDHRITCLVETETARRGPLTQRTT